LKDALEKYEVYSLKHVEDFVTLYLGGAERDQLDPVLDECVARYNADLTEDERVSFKSKAKVYIRIYEFLSTILPYSNATWEKLSIFLNFLIPKLPAHSEEDLSKGILEDIDLDSYRVEAQASLQISPVDQDSELSPGPGESRIRIREPVVDRLSTILKTFNELFGNIDWKDADKLRKVIGEEIPTKVAKDKAYQNAMKHSDKQNARIEHDIALQRVILELLTDHTELYKQFTENLSFKKWLADSIFAATYEAGSVETKSG
jgi:type I restriction enzyme R subunit